MKRFKNILLVADGHLRQDNALGRAIALAENNQADLTIVRVVDSPCGTSLSGDPVCDKLKNAITEDWQDRLSGIRSNRPPQVNISGQIFFNGVFPQIIQEVLRNGYDLVMKSAEENHGLKNRLFGSADMHLLRKCPCPVWIMSSNEKSKYQRIVAAVDVVDPDNGNSLKNLNRQILEIASSLALAEFSELHVVHAWTPPGESVLNTPRFGFSEEEIAEWAEQERESHEQKIDELMNILSEKISRDTLEYLNPQIHIVKGRAHEVIPNLARVTKADLIVMGTVARTGIPGLLIGNTAESILNNMDCSVLAVKPAEFVTPVTLEG